MTHNMIVFLGGMITGGAIIDVLWLYVKGKS